MIPQLNPTSFPCSADIWWENTLIALVISFPERFSYNGARKSSLKNKLFILRDELLFGKHSWNDNTQNETNEAEMKHRILNVHVEF